MANQPTRSKDFPNRWEIDGEPLSSGDFIEVMLAPNSVWVLAVWDKPQKRKRLTSHAPPKVYLNLHVLGDPLDKEQYDFAVLLPGWGMVRKARPSSGLWLLDAINTTKKWTTMADSMAATMRLFLASAVVKIPETIQEAAKSALALSEALTNAVEKYIQNHTSSVLPGVKELPSSQPKL